MKVIPMSYFAEYAGTFFFVLTVLASAGNPLVIGASLALVIFLIGSVSGGFVNPAISLAAFMNGSLRPSDLYMYVLAQLLGGASAYYAFRRFR